MKKDRIIFFYDQEQNKEAHSHHLSSTLKSNKSVVKNFITHARHLSKTAARHFCMLMCLWMNPENTHTHVTGSRVKSDLCASPPPRAL